MATNDTRVCEVCNLGKVVRTMQQISFHEWTSKGYVFCRITIPVLVCDGCGARNWDEDSETIIEDAVKREVDKLP